MDLLTLIRSGSVDVKYTQPYDETWSDDELLNHIRSLNCNNKQLTSLPRMPQIRRLYCCNNRLSSLPPYPELEILQCHDNQLTFLDSYPKLRMLDCYNNQLTSLSSCPLLTTLYCSRNHLTRLSSYPHLVRLDCRDNQLFSLPLYPNLLHLDCMNNPLTFLPSHFKLEVLFCDTSPVNAGNLDLGCETLTELKAYWKFRDLYLRKKYFRLWYKFLLESKRKKKYDLHLELKYSPDLPFYKEDEYWVELLHLASVHLDRS